jgi:hypothetical protein
VGPAISEEGDMTVGTAEGLSRRPHENDPFDRRHPGRTISPVDETNR